MIDKSRILEYMLVIDNLIKVNWGAFGAFLLGLTSCECDTKTVWYDFEAIAPPAGYEDD